MIRIGKYQIGWAAGSMAVVFVVLSACAVVAAVKQARPEYPLPLRDIIIINESMALAATLVYGMFVHLAIELINRLKGRQN